MYAVGVLEFDTSRPPNGCISERAHQSVNDVLPLVQRAIFPDVGRRFVVLAYGMPEEGADFVSREESD